MTTELLISFTATAISLSAFGVAIWQGYVTRRHNRLSVKPMLHFDIGMTETRLVLMLKNTGVGPAVIERFRVEINGEEIGQNPDQIVINLIDELEAAHLTGTMYFPGIGQAMAVGDAYKVIKLRNSEKDEELFEVIKYAVNVTVEYKSIYGEQFTVSSNLE